MTMLRSGIVAVFTLVILVCLSNGLTMPGNVHRLKTGGKDYPKEKSRWDSPLKLQDVELLLEQLLERRSQRNDGVNPRTVFNQQPKRSMETRSSQELKSQMKQPETEKAHQTPTALDGAEQKRMRGYADSNNALVSNKVTSHRYQDTAPSPNKAEDYRYQDSVKSSDNVEDNRYQDNVKSSNNVEDYRYQDNVKSLNTLKDYQYQNSVKSSNKVEDYRHQDNVKSLNTLKDYQYQNSVKSSNKVEDY